MPEAFDFEPYLAPSRGPRAGRAVDAPTALRAIPNGARVFLSPLAGVAQQLLAEMAALRDQWTALEIVGAFLLEPIAPLEHAGAPFRFTAWHPSTSYRAAMAAGPEAFQVMPARYSDSAWLFLLDGPYPVDVALVMVSPPGPDGRFSLGVSTGAVVDTLRTAPLVIAQVNREMPYTFGVGELPREAFDFLVEIDGPLPDMGRAGPGPEEETIAAHVAEMVPDGATLQFGLGAVPEAIIGRLSQHHDLGVHSGMVGDGIISLEASGALTNARKPFDVGVTISAEVIGTPDLFAWAHRNPRLRMAPARYTHGVGVLTRLHQLVAINSALQVALDGSINTNVAGGRIISGPGGQPDYAEAAADSAGAMSVVALLSTAAGGKVSRIVRELDPGAVASIPRTLADRVVTEYGAAALRGRSLRDRAVALRAIAHPDFQGALED